MTQVLSGVAIAAVISVCWLLGRPRPKLLRSTDTAAVAALNRSQIERVLSPAVAGSDAEAPERQQANLQGRGRQQLLAQLERQFEAGGEQRRQAMAHCSAWGHRAALPLIRRGLRDADLQVVALAAEAMARFRGRTSLAPAAGATSKPQASKRPRTVSRTR